MTARAVTEATFEQEVLKNDKAVLVDFWAEWCGPCRMVSPILDQIATEHADKLDIVKLNVDENPAARDEVPDHRDPRVQGLREGRGRQDRHRRQAEARPRGRPRRLHRVVGRLAHAETRPAHAGRVFRVSGGFDELRMPRAAPLVISNEPPEPSN